MNIVEAIKSGKPFKRKVWDIYYIMADDDIDVLTPLEPKQKGCWRLGKKDWIADDWEIKDTDVTITQIQFYEAAWKAFGHFKLETGEHNRLFWFCGNKNTENIVSCIQVMASILGFNN
jgi:hypothetical protein